MWCSECVCARTACASLPVLVAHCEDFLHPVIHGFGEPAELLAFLLPAVTRTKNTVSLTGNIFQSHLTPQLFYADLHFQQVQVCRFGLYRGEDHHTHRLVLLRFSLPRLPVLCRHTAHFKTRSKQNLPFDRRGATTNLLIPVGEESLENFTAGDNGMPAHPGHPALQPLHAHLDKLFLKSSWNGREKKKKEEVVSAVYLYLHSAFVMTDT